MDLKRFFIHKRKTDFRHFLTNFRKINENEVVTLLKYETKKTWVDHVLKNIDAFLLDHAAAEKKAAGMAISMISHYPDKPHLVKIMANLAIEEMCHYRSVIAFIYSRQKQLKSDQKDEYIHALHALMRKGTEAYFLDRLLIAAIVEARGAERFSLIANAMEKGKLQKFYHQIAQSEQHHYQLFIELAQFYFNPTDIDKRLNYLLQEEAKICKSLPIHAKLH